MQTRRCAVTRKSVFRPRQWIGSIAFIAASSALSLSRAFSTRQAVSTKAIRFWAERGNGTLMSVASSFEARRYELLNRPKNERPAARETLNGAGGVFHAASTNVSEWTALRSAHATPIFDASRMRARLCATIADAISAASDGIVPRRSQGLIRATNKATTRPHLRFLGNWRCLRQSTPTQMPTSPLRQRRSQACKFRRLKCDGVNAEVGMLNVGPAAAVISESSSQRAQQRRIDSSTKWRLPTKDWGRSLPAVSAVRQDAKALETVSARCRRPAYACARRPS